MKLKFKYTDGTTMTIDATNAQVDITGVPKPTVEDIYADIVTNKEVFPDPARAQLLTSLRTSVVRVAQAAGASLEWVGLAIDPTLEQIDFQAKHRLRGWNTLCATIIDHIEAMKDEITTLRQMNKGLHADLDGMVAQAEETKKQLDQRVKDCVNLLQMPEEQREQVRKEMGMGPGPCKTAEVPKPGAVRAEWDTRVMMPEQWDGYIYKIREYHGMSQFRWDCLTNEAKKHYADKYDEHATYRRLQEGRF